MDVNEFDRLMTGIYESVLQPDGWAAVLQDLSGQLAVDNLHFMVWRADEEGPRYSLSRGMDEAMEAGYRAHYGAIDPRRLLVAQWEPGRWLACHQHFDRRTVARSEFFQDYLIPGGCRYLLGTRLAHGDGLDAYLGMHRAAGRPAFDASEIELVERLTPHLQRAVRIWLRTEELRDRARLGTEALDEMELGVMAVGAGGRLFHANRRAEALLRAGDALRLQAGVLAAAGDGAARLQSALAEAVATRQSQSLHLVAPSGPCSLTILPLPAAGPLARLLDRAELLVLASHGASRRMPTARQLMQLFGLTPAEARLAKALAGGDALDAYAQENDLGMTTVRSHLRSVFTKTGTRRQAGLVRLLAGIPATRG